MGWSGSKSFSFKLPLSGSCWFSSGTVGMSEGNSTEQLGLKPPLRPAPSAFLSLSVVSSRGYQVPSPGFRLDSAGGWETHPRLPGAEVSTPASAAVWRPRLPSWPRFILLLCPPVSGLTLEPPSGQSCTRPECLLTHGPGPGGTEAEPRPGLREGMCH